MLDIQAILLSLGTIIAIPVILKLLIRAYLSTSERDKEETGKLPEANAESNPVLIAILTAAIAAYEADDY